MALLFGKKKNYPLVFITYEKQEGVTFATIN